MENFQKNMPTRISVLLIGYFANVLNEVEQNEINDWVNASMDNQRVFENCLEMSLRVVRHNSLDDDDNNYHDLKYSLN